MYGVELHLSASLQEKPTLLALALLLMDCLVATHVNSQSLPQCLLVVDGMCYAE